MRNATVHEIAEEAEMQEDEVYSVMNEHFYANILSIDEQPDADEKDGSYSIKDEKAIIPEEKVLKNELLEEMAEKILQLNEKEQMVLSLFYKEELTLTEIGEVMGLSTSRISQIHSKSIFKLRQLLEKAI